MISIITTCNIFRGNKRGPSLQKLILNRFPFKNIGKFIKFIFGRFTSKNISTIYIHLIKHVLHFKIQIKWR